MKYRTALNGVIILLVVALQFLLFALPAGAQTGKIVFSSQQDGDFEIFIMNADGSGAAQLTFNTATDYLPALSPDQTKIAFVSKRDGNYEIYIMETDGTNQTRLTSDAAVDEYPKFSPDGTEVVFGSNRDGDYEIYTIDTTGSNLTPLTSNIVDDTNPSYSPDGTRITFVSQKDHRRWEIYAMDDDGSNETRLTQNSKIDWFPTYSPDGTDITYTTSASGSLEIYKMNADGSNQTRLTFSPGRDAYSTYSPDGTKIAFASNRDGDYEIYTMDADGTNATQLTFNTDKDLYPFWGETADQPSTTISTSPAVPDGDSGWFISPATVSLTSDRPGTTYYSWNSSPPQGPGDPVGLGWTQYSGNFSALEGDNTLFYWSKDTLGSIESPVKSAQIKLDTVDPSDPSTVESSSHSVGVPSVDDTVDVNWSGESDAISGVDGFSTEWSNSAGTTPDEVKDLEETTSSTTSPALADGNWWFHLKTKDNAGRWTGTVHLGPFVIGAAPLAAEGVSHTVCTNCHDGQVTGAPPVIPEFAKASAHPTDPDISTACQDCHNADGDLDGGGLYYPKLLKAEDPFAVFQFIGDAYCGACHGDGSVLPGGDMLVHLTGTSHDTDLSDPDSGTEIKCLNCHTQHGSDFGPLLAETINAEAINGNNNSACYPCHAAEKGAFGGEVLYELTKHFSTAVSDKAEVVWPASSYLKGYCLNCHNPHGTTSTDYRRDDENALCNGCHDIVGIPAGYGYQGSASYDLSRHGLDSQPENIWPDSDETGSFTGSGGATSGECINCHNAHGKEDGGTPTAKDTLRHEEGLCFGGNPAAGKCHAGASGSENGINIYERFTAGDGVVTPPELSRHSIGDVDQGVTGSKVECSDCHNSHLDNRANKTSDPDLISSSFTDTMDEPTLFPKAVIQPGPGTGKDSLIASGFPTVNFSATTSFLVGYLDLGSYEKSRALYEFDVSGIPAGSTVTSATFNLYQAASANASDLTVDLHEVTASWDDATVDWNSQPSFNATTEDSEVLSSSNDVWRTWDVTALVDDWVNGVVSNNGMILIAPDAEAGAVDWFRVFNASNKLLSPTLTYSVASRPKLVVEYTTASPPQTMDSIGFCGRCHDGAPPAGVTVPGTTKQIIPDYTNTDAQGDYHGGRAGVLNPLDTSEGDIIGPYYAGMPALACDDCHDSHGSANIYNILDEVNGNSVSITSAANKSSIRNFCGSCHMFYHVPVQSCFECHFHGANTDGDVNTVF